MAQLLERPRSRRPFARMDILAHLGETICLPRETPPPTHREIAPPRPMPAAPTQILDEDPERWDGLS